MSEWVQKIISSTGENHSAVIVAYGMEQLLYGLLQTGLVILAGCITREYVVTAVYLALTMGLRRATGGFHAPTRLTCTLTTMLMWVVSVVATSMLSVHRPNAVVLAIVLAVDVLLIFLLAPVEHINKELSQEQRARNRKISCVSGVLIAAVIWLLRDTQGQTVYALLTKKMVKMA